MHLSSTLIVSGSSPVTFYSLEVIAKDGGIPQLMDVSTVLINVTRNNNRPVWRSDHIKNITILETQALSDAIDSVSKTCNHHRYKSKPHSVVFMPIIARCSEIKDVT